MVTCQSANQLKTPAKDSWAFKMFSQFGSLGYTIMGKTADLTVVQKTIINTLHKEGKPQTFIAKEAVCSQSAVSKHVNRSKVLFSDESKFCNSVGNQGPRVWRKGGEAHSRSYLKSSVKFPQSVMIWGPMSSAGVGPLCFLKTNITASVYQEIVEHFMLPSADQLFKDADFIFQQDLAPGHTAKITNSWLSDHGVGVLDWPANSPDLNIENLWGIVKRKMRNKRSKNADELKATVKETWASTPPQQCHKLITSMPRWIEAVIKAEGAPTKYWVHIQ